MTTAAKPITEIAAQWREARKLYVIYSALLERFALGAPPCPELDSPIDRNEPEALERAAKWMLQMDERIHVHQLRQLLQTSQLSTEEYLRPLITHHLQKAKKNEADRDKIDFLLVQYLCLCAPPAFYERSVAFEEIAQILEPLLGEVGAHPPRWLEPLEQATSQLDSLRSLRDLLEQGTLEQMRKLKAGGGEMYFGPTALAAITRFNFLVRKSFGRLIAADLHAIRFSLNELERRGVATVDCTRANLSSQESIDNLRQACHEWKKPFRAAYAAGHNFKELIEIRTAVEDTLAHAPQSGSAAPSSKKPDVSAAPASNGTPLPLEKPADKQHNDPIAVEFTHKAQPKITPPKPAAPELMSMQAPAQTTTPAGGTPAPSAIAPAIAAEMQAAVDQINRELTKNHVKAGSVANIPLGGVKLMLSSWEVGAFLQNADETTETLQRAVAARAVIAAQIERRKRGEIPLDLPQVIKMAQLESGKIQARIASAKQAKDIDSAVNLAATHKRLLALMDEAVKPRK